VVLAALRKYPNPINRNVIGIDTIERNVSCSGALLSHRILSTEWGLSSWITRVCIMRHTLLIKCLFNLLKLHSQYIEPNNGHLLTASWSSLVRPLVHSGALYNNILSFCVHYCKINHCEYTKLREIWYLGAENVK